MLLIKECISGMFSGVYSKSNWEVDEPNVKAIALILIISTIEN